MMFLRNAKSTLRERYDERRHGWYDKKKEESRESIRVVTSGAVQLNAPERTREISEQDTWEVGGREGLS